MLYLISIAVILALINPTIECMSTTSKRNKNLFPGNLFVVARAESRLHDYLFSNKSYTPSIRPVRQANRTIQVGIKVGIRKILYVVSGKQICRFDLINLQKPIQLSSRMK